MSSQRDGIRTSAPPDFNGLPSRRAGVSLTRVTDKVGLVMLRGNSPGLNFLSITLLISVAISSRDGTELLALAID